MKRNKLSLRISRETSNVRPMGSNKEQLSQYISYSEAVMKMFFFGQSQIFNMNETGVQTISNINIVPTEKREVSKAVAAEQGQTVTAVCAMNALGYLLHAFFIYPRRRENPLLIKGHPLGYDMALTNKGFMNIPTLIKWLNHFKGIRIQIRTMRFC